MNEKETFETQDDKEEQEQDRSITTKILTQGTKLVFQLQIHWWMILTEIDNNKIKSNSHEDTINGSKDSISKTQLLEEDYDEWMK